MAKYLQVLMSRFEKGERMKRKSMKNKKKEEESANKEVKKIKG